MKRKKRINLRVLILLVLFSIASLSTSDTYAYWASSVTGNNDTAIGTVQTGTWTQTFTWQPGVTYSSGDIVIYNGVTYQSLKNNNTKTPGANGTASWWQAI